MSRDKEDERKILRRSHSYVEEFFVRSDAVAGHKPKSDVMYIVHSLVIARRDQDAGITRALKRGILREEVRSLIIEYSSLALKAAFSHQLSSVSL